MKTRRSWTSALMLVGLGCGGPTDSPTDEATDSASTAESTDGYPSSSTGAGTKGDAGPSTGGSATSTGHIESTNTSRSTSSTGGSTALLLDVRDIGWLCNTDPPAGAVLPLEDVLFKHKRRLRFEPGVYDVFGGEEVPFEYEFEGQDRPLIKEDPVVTVEAGAWEATPWGVAINDTIPGQVTLKYMQVFDTDPPTQESELGTPPLVVHVTERKGDAEVPEAFVLEDDKWTAYYASHLGPCVPRGPSDFLVVSLAEGELLLEARPGRFASGFLIGASGTVDGIEIDVGGYYDLGMYADDIYESYLGLPAFAVRWPASPGPQGECGLVLQPDLDTGDYAGWFIDCDLEPIRDVTVFSVQLQ